MPHFTPSCCTIFSGQFFELPVLLEHIDHVWSNTAPDNDHTELGNHITNHIEPNCDSDNDLNPVPESELIEQINHLQSEEVENQQECIQENGQSSDSELSLGSEGEEEAPHRYPSPCQLKKIRNQESQELNSELRVLITKEIRKPGRRKL